MYLRTMLVVALALVSPIRSPAQTPTDTALSRIKPGHELRVRTLDGQLIQSRLIALDQAPLQLLLRGQEAPLLGASVDSLWVRRGAGGTGALVGAIAVGVPSFIFWTSNCDAIDEVPSCDFDDWALVVGFTLVPAGVAALIGAVVGGRIPRWRLHYARQPAPAGSLSIRARPTALWVSLDF